MVVQHPTHPPDAASTSYLCNRRTTLVHDLQYILGRDIGEICVSGRQACEINVGRLEPGGFR